jgi:hypothetical protein
LSWLVDTKRVEPVAPVTVTGMITAGAPVGVSVTLAWAVPSGRSVGSIKMLKVDPLGVVIPLAALVFSQKAPGDVVIPYTSVSPELVTEIATGVGVTPPP